MDIVAIRGDLGLALAETGVTAVTKKPGSIMPPSAILGTYNIQPHSAMGGLQSIVTWTILMCVADAADGAVEDLDAYLSDAGDKSLMVALEGYASDNWDSLTMLPTEDISVIQVGATEYLGCAFQVEILC